MLPHSVRNNSEPETKSKHPEQLIGYELICMDIHVLLHFLLEEFVCFWDEDEYTIQEI